MHGLRRGLFRQRLDYPALANSAMPAYVERALQLASQGDKLSNAAVNVIDMAASDDVHLGTGAVRLLAERQQFPHGGRLKA
jgi:hypothetical protein